MKARLALVLASFVWLEFAAAQPDATRRIGLLVLSPSANQAFRDWSLPELTTRGFVERRNLAIDVRAGGVDQMLKLARELADIGPDVIVAVGGNAVAAAKAVTSRVPIVSVGANPVQLGFAASLSRPGGNVTGLAIIGSELDAKRLQVLAEARPGLKRVAALILAGSPTATAIRRDMQRFADPLGLDLLAFTAGGPEDYARSFAAMRAAGAQALVVTANPIFYRDAELIARLAVEAGLPTACEWREMAERGCFIGYGPSRAEIYRRAGLYVARLLEGAQPAEMPIEQPSRFELVLNQKVALALGLEIPPSVLAQADEVIE